MSSLIKQVSNKNTRAREGINEEVKDFIARVYSSPVELRSMHEGKLIFRGSHKMPVEDALHQRKGPNIFYPNTRVEITIEIPIHSDIITSDVHSCRDVCYVYPSKTLEYVTSVIPRD